MISILGIDAAWTEHEPSGVAMVVQDSAGSRCLIAAPSYEAFLARAAGKPIDWRARQAGGAVDLVALVRASAAIAGREPDAISVDMPLSHERVQSRRAADQAVSRAFGKLGASTHSPNIERPGQVSVQMMAQAKAVGFALSTVPRAGDQSTPQLPALIETYPHPLIIHLLRLKQRLLYKVSKSSKYWPNTDTVTRRRKLLESFAQLNAALELEFGELPIPLPKLDSTGSLQELKRYEDALDAVVCC